MTLEMVTERKGLEITRRLKMCRLPIHMLPLPWFLTLFCVSRFQYLASEGFLQFLDWFDDRGWYPLGRIIGGTIYPGLMFTAAVMYWVLNFFNITINIREVRLG